mmetsp:Transcript_38098/g.74841  ORF Transcript_38098/g.74841 Transcript_38098/m.74841 type:complete len:140 (+) Transcript_38098:143-562(+)
MKPCFAFLVLFALLLRPASTEGLFEKLSTDTDTKDHQVCGYRDEACSEGEACYNGCKMTGEFSSFKYVWDGDSTDLSYQAYTTADCTGEPSTKQIVQQKAATDTCYKQGESVYVKAASVALIVNSGLVFSALVLSMLLP